MTDPDPTARLPLPEEPPVAAPPPVAPPPSVAPSPDPGVWRPAREDDRRLGPIIFGLILLGIGLWFFAERTLGLPMPDVSWGQLWPLILVGLGLWILLSSVRRGPR